MRSNPKAQSRSGRRISSSVIGDMSIPFEIKGQSGSDSMALNNTKGGTLDVEIRFVKNYEQALNQTRC